MLKLGFLISNNGSAMRAVIEAIDRSALSAELRLVVSNKADALGLAFARTKGIGTLVIPTLPDPAVADHALCEALIAAGVEVVVLSGYLRKLGPRTLETFAGRILNTHPALLPKFGGPGMYGRRVHDAVLTAGERVTGATIHLVDSDYDHGEILAQQIVPIPEGASVETIEHLVMKAEASLLIQTLSLLPVVHGAGALRVIPGGRMK